jgi:hypothetical protein
MKQFKIAALAVIAATLFGCASTAPRERTEYPTLTVLSPTPYVWDDSKSVALNVATMALPAGVGKGMKDYATKEEATNGQSTAGERAFGNAIMGISQGVFGVMSAMTQTSRVDKALAWQPSLVDLIPVSEVGPLDKDSFLKLRSIISQRVRTSLDAAISDIKWHDTIYTSNSTRFGNDFDNVFVSDKCVDYMRFHALYPDKVGAFDTKDRSARSIEKVPYPTEYCMISLNLAVATTISRDGVSYYVVVSSFDMGHNFINQLRNTYPGYILLPNSFTVSAVDQPATLDRSLPYSLVIYQGKEEYFVKP